MPIAWFICTYKRRPGIARPTRYCGMDDHTGAIRADGGTWSESEVLGNSAIVKVRASAETLTAIANDPNIQRIPVGLLDDSLGSLTVTQRTAIRDRVLAMGYTTEEVTAALGNDLSAVTLRTLLQFVTGRRQRPRYEAGTDTIVLDGVVEACRPFEALDEEVQ